MNYLPFFSHAPTTDRRTFRVSATSPFLEGYELRRICYLHRLLSFSAALKHAFCSPARLPVLSPSAHNPIPFSGNADSTCHLVCSLSRYFTADITGVLQITDSISRSVGFSVSFQSIFFFVELRSCRLIKTTRRSPSCGFCFWFCNFIVGRKLKRNRIMAVECETRLSQTYTLKILYVCTIKKTNNSRKG